MSGRRAASLVALVGIAIILASAMAAAQTTYALKVSTDATSYAGTATIKIIGSVLPPPGPSTAVTLKLINPSGAVLGVWYAAVGASSGSFNYTLVAGGNSGWTPGTYTVNATWGAYPPQRYAKATFTYSPTATTTTTTTSTSASSSTSTTSITASTNTTTTTSSTASTTTTSSGGGGIAEFPFQVVSTGLLVAVVAVGYLLLRKRSLAGSRIPATR